MKISHKWLNPKRKSIHSEDKILTIKVKQGWKEGNKITFPKEGDQTSNNIPANIIFVLKDKPHNIFKIEMTLMSSGSAFGRFCVAVQ